MLYVNCNFLGRIPKERESLKDCQDFLAAKGNCLAIADGSSQSFYPSIWAKLLVEHFCKSPNLDGENWQDWLFPIQEQWLAEVTRRVEIAKSKKNPVWITNQNRLNHREAATSTFVGLRLLEKKLKLSIVGDSCLFVWQKDKNKLETFILQSSQEFDDRPEYFGSFSKDNKFQPECFELDLNDFELKHTFFLVATDALAEWILKSWEQEKDIFPYLLGINSLPEFEDLMSKARNNPKLKLKNDDTTLISFQISAKKINIPDFLPQDFVEDFEQVEEIEKAEKEVDNFFDTKDVKSPSNDDFNNQQQARINQLIKKNRKISKFNKKATDFNKILGILLALSVILSISFFFQTLNLKGKIKSNESDITSLTNERARLVSKTRQNLKENDELTIFKGEDIIERSNRRRKVIINSLETKVEANIKSLEDDYYLQVKLQDEFYIKNPSPDEFQCKGNEIILKKGKSIYSNQELLEKGRLGVLVNDNKFTCKSVKNKPDILSILIEGYIKK